MGLTGQRINPSVGDLTGPDSAVNNRVPFFDGASGKLIKDSGLLLSGSNTGDRNPPPPEPIVNGTMNIWQRGTSFVSPATLSVAADQWKVQFSGATPLTTTISRQGLSSAAIHTATGQKLNYALRMDVDVIDASVAASDFYMISQYIEGYKAVPFMHNEFTWSMYVRANATGTYYMAFRSRDLPPDRSYVKSFTIDAANVWERKEITVPVQDQTGTWDYTNSVGIICSLVLVAGTNFHGTDGVWNSSNSLAATGISNWGGVATNNFDITGVQIDLGPKAYPFRGLGIDEDLAAAQRYFQKSYAFGTDPGTNTVLGAYRSRSPSTAFSWPMRLHPPMSKAPTIVIYTEAGVTGNLRDLQAAADRVAAISGTSDSGFNVTASVGVVDGNTLAWHFAAEAKL